MLETVVYLGVDVAKNDLQCFLGKRSFRVANSPAGFARLLERVQAANASVHVICEATGAYQNAMVDFLHHHCIPVSVLNPLHARHFARSRGALAKTDAMDARQLAEFGRANQPAPTPAPPEYQRRLKALVAQRDRLVTVRAEEKKRLQQSCEDPCTEQIQRCITFYDSEIKKLDNDLKAFTAATPELATRVVRLESVPGVGTCAAHTLMAYLPELGTLNRRSIAKLAGIAPLNCDSGQFRGQRHIHGGRAEVRRILYLAANVAKRFYPPLRDFYTKLKAQNKPFKVAIIAVARKLLILLNSMIKNPDFSLAP
jgi:transposase